VNTTGTVPIPQAATLASARGISRVAISYEGKVQGGDFDLSFAEGLRACGCTIEWVKRIAPIPTDIDLLLAYGPFSLNQSMMPSARRLLTLPTATRPLFAWWLTEGIPDPTFPDWLVYAGSTSRIRADDLWRNSHALRAALRRLHLVHFYTAGHRLRVFAELRWLHTHGVLDVLAVTSASRATYLRGRGLNPLIVPLGYNAQYGKDMQLPRDIPVAFLGDTKGPRRQQLMPRMQAALAARNIPLLIENNLYGDARNQFLNRTRILINILRAPQDHVGQRLLLAAANKTLIISEPIPDTEPFEPGKHLVVTSLEKMPETVAYYLAHEPERAKITDAAYMLATRDITTANMVGRILDRANRLRA
jgi:hypothetical protein